MGTLEITGLDHIVLRVSDVDRSLDFYRGVLGLEGERVEEFRAGSVGFPSVRIDDRTVIDLFPVDAPVPRGANGKVEGGLDHVCLVAAGTDVEAVVAALAEQGVPVHLGPATRWGARGEATSVYLLDPDGVEVEIRCYPDS